MFLVYISMQFFLCMYKGLYNLFILAKKRTSLLTSHKTQTVIARRKRSQKMAFTFIRNSIFANESRFDPRN